MLSKSLRLQVIAALILGGTIHSAKSQVTSSATLSLNSLTVTPAAGDITWNGWSVISVESIAQNISEGQVQDFPPFGSGLGTFTSSASVTDASANSVATVTSSDPSGISGQAFSTVGIAANQLEAAAAVGGSTWAATFSLSEETTVSISVLLGLVQNTVAGGNVFAGENQAGLVVALDNGAALDADAQGYSYNSVFLPGPGEIDSLIATPAFNDSVDLSAGLHGIAIELVSEQSFVNFPVPEQGNGGLLLLSGLGSLAALGWVSQRRAST